MNPGGELGKQRRAAFIRESSQKPIALTSRVGELGMIDGRDEQAQRRSTGGEISRAFPDDAIALGE
jgi:hypothetical protein